jgi:hypothetical protein
MPWDPPGVIRLDSSSHRLLVRHIRLHRYRDTLPNSDGARIVSSANFFVWAMRAAVNNRFGRATSYGVSQPVAGKEYTLTLISRAVSSAVSA